MPLNLDNYADQILTLLKNYEAGEVAQGEPAVLQRFVADDGVTDDDSGDDLRAMVKIGMARLLLDVCAKPVAEISPILDECKEIIEGADELSENLKKHEELSSSLKTATRQSLTPVDFSDATIEDFLYPGENRAPGYKGPDHEARVSRALKILRYKA